MKGIEREKKKRARETERMEEVLRWRNTREKGGCRERGKGRSQRERERKIM